MIEFKQIETQEEFILHYKFIVKIPLSHGTHETVLANCLLGKFIGYSFIKDGESVGILICDNRFPVMYIIGHYTKGFKDFDRDLFYTNLKKDGYTKVQCSSTIDYKKVEKWSGLKKVYSVFEKEL